MSLWDDLGFLPHQVTAADELAASASESMDLYMADVVELYKQGEGLLAPPLAATIAFNKIRDVSDEEGGDVVYTVFNILLLGATAIDRLMRRHLDDLGLLKVEDQTVAIDDMPEI